MKDYFLDYRETASNDFVLTKGGQHVEMLDTDISDWTITFIDTGIDTAIGERLRRVRPYLEDDEMFLANYGDVLTDAPMNDLIDEFAETDAVAQFLAVKPQDSFHVVDIADDGRVTGLVPVADMSMCINGGYFVLRQGIFDYLEEGDDLVMDGCVRASRDGGARGPLPGLLGADGHPEGADRPGEPVQQRGQSLGAVARPAGGAGRAGAARRTSRQPPAPRRRPRSAAGCSQPSVLPLSCPYVRAAPCRATGSRFPRTSAMNCHGPDVAVVAPPVVLVERDRLLHDSAAGTATSSGDEP